MSDLIRRMDAVQACQVGPSDEWSRSTKSGYNQAATDCAMNMLRIPAVQPDVRIKEYEDAYQYALHLAEALRENYPPNPDFRFLGDLVGLLTQIDNMVAGLSQPAVQPDPREAALRKALYGLRKAADDLDGYVGRGYGDEYLELADRLALIDKPGHVNETPKSEHEAEVMLTPATKGGHP